MKHDYFSERLQELELTQINMPELFEKLNQTRFHGYCLIVIDRYEEVFKGIDSKITRKTWLLALPPTQLKLPSSIPSCPVIGQDEEDL